MKESAKYKIFHILFSVSSWLPVFIPYMVYRGLGLDEALLIVAARSFASAVFEYPTGVIGDYYGHKASIIIGLIIYIFSISLFLLPLGLGGYLLTSIVMGFGLSLVSGSDSALLHRVSSEFDKDYSQVRAYDFISFAISTAIGGLLGATSLFLPVYLTIIANIVGLSFVSSISTVAIDKPDSKEEGGNIYNTAREGIRNIRGNLTLRYAVFAGALLSVVSYSYKYQINIVFEIFELPVTYVGVIISGIVAAGALGALGGNRLKVSSAKLYTLLIALLILTAFLPNAYMIGGLFILLKFLSEVISVRLELIVNRYAEDRYRASVLSAMSLVRTLFYSLFLYGIGLYAIEIGYTYVASFSVLIMVLSILSFSMLYKQEKMSFSDAL